MDGLLSPNPARNPLRKDGAGKSDKEFLLSFREVFTSPPAQLLSNMRKAGVTSPATPPPPTTPTRSTIPSINVTPAMDRHERVFVTPDAKTERNEIIKFIQYQTRKRLAAKEEQLNKQEKYLEREFAQLAREKLSFYQEKMAHYSKYINLQARLESGFRHLSDDMDALEAERLNDAAHFATRLVEVEDQKDNYVELQVEAKMPKAQLEKRADRMIVVAKGLMDFLQTKERTSEEHQAALAEFETELRVLAEEKQQGHIVDENGQDDLDSHDDSAGVPSSGVKIPYGGKNALVLIGGIPNGVSKVEAIRAVDIISGKAIRVHGIFPGSSSATAVGYFAEYPEKFFEGKLFVTKDLQFEPIGDTACLRFRVVDI